MTEKTNLAADPNKKPTTEGTPVNTENPQTPTHQTQEQPSPAQQTQEQPSLTQQTQEQPSPTQPTQERQITPGLSNAEIYSAYSRIPRMSYVDTREMEKNLKLLNVIL